MSKIQPVVNEVEKHHSERRGNVRRTLSMQVKDKNGNDKKFSAKETKKHLKKKAGGGGGVETRVVVGAH